MFIPIGIIIFLVLFWLFRAVVRMVAKDNEERMRDFEIEQLEDKIEKLENPYKSSPNEYDY